MYSRIIFPASILAGTIIGAGMFSLPTLFVQIGFVSGLFYISLFALAFIAVYLLYADIILRTQGDHRFIGYAEKYLGKPGFWASLSIGLFELFFVLAVYLILAPSFSHLFLPDGNVWHLVGFWVIGSAAILFNSRKVALFEFLILLGMLGIIGLIFLSGARNFAGSGIGWGAFNLHSYFLAGPILFALSGVLAVPETLSYFKEAKTSYANVRLALVLGGALPAIAYIAYIIGILGLSSSPSADSVSGLLGAISPLFLATIGVLGLLCLISSYIVVGLNARRILQFDLGIPDIISKALVLIIPLLLYFLGFQNFLKAVSFIGSIFLPLESMIVILMWLRLSKYTHSDSVLIPKWIQWLIPIVFVLFFTVFLKGLL